MQVIPGNLIIAYKDGVPIFCGTDVNFNEQKELIEATTITSNGWGEFRLRKRKFSCVVTGLTKVDDTDGQLDFFTLLGLDQNTNIGWSLVSMDQDGNTRTIAGPMKIAPESSITGPAEDWSKAQVTFIGDGDYNVT